MITLTPAVECFTVGLLCALCYAAHRGLLHDHISERFRSSTDSVARGLMLAAINLLLVGAICLVLDAICAAEIFALGGAL